VACHPQIKPNAAAGVPSTSSTGRGSSSTQKQSGSTHMDNVTLYPDLTDLLDPVLTVTSLVAVFLDTALYPDLLVRGPVQLDTWTQTG
jgi:hypothetical protein